MFIKDKYSKISLKAKISILLLTLITATAVVGMINIIQILKYYEKDMLHSFGIFASSLVDNIEDNFKERYNDVQTFSENGSLISGKPLEIQKSFNSHILNESSTLLILYTDLNGKFVAANNVGQDSIKIDYNALSSHNFLNAEWHKNTVKGKFTDFPALKLHGTYVEDAVIDPIIEKVYGSKKLVTSFSSLVKNHEEEPVGVLTVYSDFIWVEEHFLTQIKSLINQEPSINVFLVNKNGDTLVNLDPARGLGSAEKVIRDFDKVILKSNPAKENDSSALLVKEMKSGEHMVWDSIHGANMVTGYSSFKESLGWGLIIKAPENEVFAHAFFIRNISYVLFGVSFVLCAFLGHLFSSGVTIRLADILSRLKTASANTITETDGLTLDASKVSSATTEQASAVQETVATLDELSAMVGKSVENVDKSSVVAQNSHEIATSGKQTVDEMIHSIEEISESNAVIMNQINESNQQISDIVKVINEIGNKTKVINDIVFQTKLLSFNASVEAARAGEHGKGFAVVAEEVGNLAQMSGNAAQEISSMLSSSIEKVEGIVNNTKSKVDGLVLSAKSKVDNGITIAKRCGEILDQVVLNVGEVNQRMSDIAGASKDQAAGIQNISTAMNELDKTTNHNAEAANHTAQASKEIALHSNSINGMVKEFENEVFGDNSEVPKSKPNNSISKVVKSSEHLSKNNVIPFQKKVHQSKSKSTEEPKPQNNVAPSTVNGVVVPSEDDPRFADV